MKELPEKVDNFFIVNDFAPESRLLRMAINSQSRTINKLIDYCAELGDKVDDLIDPCRPASEIIPELEPQDTPIASSILKKEKCRSCWYYVDRERKNIWACEKAHPLHWAKCPDWRDVKDGEPKKQEQEKGAPFDEPVTYKEQEKSCETCINDHDGIARICGPCIGTDIRPHWQPKKEEKCAISDKTLRTLDDFARAMREGISGKVPENICLCWDCGKPVSSAAFVIREGHIEHVFCPPKSVEEIKPEDTPAFSSMQKCACGETLVNGMCEKCRATWARQAQRCLDGKLPDEPRPKG